MKKNYYFFILLFVTAFSNAQEAFITTWDVNNSSDNSIDFWISGENINYTIDFGDGTVLTNQNANSVIHDYTEQGIYTVSMTGNFPSIRFQNSIKLLTVEQWGDNVWQSMQAMFEGCANLTITAVDVPNLSQVTDMSYIFFNCNTLNHSFDNWDVSNITNMERAFQYCSNFNQPLNNWDVSSVTNMKSMFEFCYAFNQPIDNWDVSNVIDMYTMFGDCHSFNQDISNWDFNNEVALGFFVTFTDMSVDNYDALLGRFVDLQLENKIIYSFSIEYCDENVRNQLIDNLGWDISGDSLAENCATANLVSLKGNKITVYPNPVNNILHVETKAVIDIEEVKVYNLQGNQLRQLNQNLESINTESLSSGIYLLSIKTDKGSVEYKLIKN